MISAYELVMTPIEEFINEFEGDQRNILIDFHHLFVDELNLTSKIRFGIPFYYGRSWIFYLNPIKTGGIELAFVRGNELSNSQGLLDSKGRKQVYGIEFQNMKSIQKELILETIHEAIILDETIPYASKNKKK